jgi:hypothetical protein
MISDQFLPESTGSWQESTGKKSEKLSVEILLPFPRNFWCFSTGYGDFPASLLRDTVAGIFDLGIGGAYCIQCADQTIP